jgi:hypothetical protein
MTIRKCSTCKHYEPAPIWRKGWCRNPLLYSPQQSHLVGEDDLDCDRGMGNYWEPIELYPETAAAANADDSRSNQVGVPHSAIRSRENDPPSDDPADFRYDYTEPERRGGVVSQYGGPGRPTGSGGFGSGSGDGGDDDRYQTSPFDEGGRDPYGSERTPFGYQPEERYWTDYLRIAAPVVGVILMLGLVWFWIASMLGNNDDDNDVATNGDDVSGPVIESETPTPTDDADDNGVITIMTPEPDDDETDEPANGEPAPTTIGPGATVVVVGTGEAGLNVRSSPSTGADVVDSVPDGTTMTVTGESQQGDGFTWWPVEFNGVTGFVAEDFIDLSQ